jgi:hypothetical protein
MAEIERGTAVGHKAGTILGRTERVELMWGPKDGQIAEVHASLPYTVSFPANRPQPSTVLYELERPVTKNIRYWFVGWGTT